MALQSSGTISIGNIRSELGTSDGSLRNLSATAGKSTPDAISEFYGYSNLPYYRYGFPIALFDMAAGSGYYGTADSTVPSLGGGTDGIFTQGTGGGLAVNKTGYTASPGYFDFQQNPEFSISTTETRDVMSGTNPYSIVIWFNHTGWTGGYSYPGLDGHGGAFEWIISNDVAGNRMWHKRGSDYAFINFSSVSAYSTGTWYMVNIRYNGTTINLDWYKAGTRYNSNTTSSYSLSGGGSFQLPLRYNNYLYSKIGYFASYSSDIGTAGGDAIFNATRSRYGV